MIRTCFMHDLHINKKQDSTIIFNKFSTKIIFKASIIIIISNMKIRKWKANTIYEQISLNRIESMCYRVKNEPEYMYKLLETNFVSGQNFKIFKTDKTINYINY